MTPIQKALKGIRDLLEEYRAKYPNYDSHIKERDERELFSNIRVETARLADALECCMEALEFVQYDFDPALELGPPCGLIAVNKIREAQARVMEILDKKEEQNGK